MCAGQDPGQGQIQACNCVWTEHQHGWGEDGMKTTKGAPVTISRSVQRLALILRKEEQDVPLDVIKGLGCSIVTEGAPQGWSDIIELIDYPRVLYIDRS